MNFGASPKIQLNDNVFEFIEFTATRIKTMLNNMPNEPIIYGVNVEKVKEVIRLPAIVPCLSNSPELIGVFSFRGKPIPVIHLAKVLGHEKEEITASHQIIVTEFSKRFIGFIVAQTKRIRRVNSNKILPPSCTAFNTITGMMSAENNYFIFILDFEKILFDIENKLHSQQENFAFSAETGTQELSTTPKPIVIVVDDSPTARLAVTGILKSMNLEVIEYANGEIAWNELKDIKDLNQLKAIISDVEMPQLDGYSLVKRIKSHALLKQVPIILHSSLSGDTNRDRAKEAGANAYINKLNRKEMKAALDQVFENKIKG